MVKKLLIFFSFLVLSNSLISQSVSLEFSSPSYVLGVKEKVEVSGEVKLTGKEDFKNTILSVSFDKGIDVGSCYFYDLKEKKRYLGTSSVLVNGQIVYTFSSLCDLKSKGSNKYYIISEVSVGLFDENDIAFVDNSVFNLYFSLESTSDKVDVNSNAAVQLVLDVDDLTNLIFANQTGISSSTVLTNSWTVSTIDFNNDNYDDLFFTDATMSQPNKLFKNDGTGSFTEVTSGAIVTDLAKSMSSSWADYDNDGDLDVVVANSSMKPCSFYINNGDETFTKNITAAFTKNVGYYHHVSWVDVDNDGQLELYLANYLPSRLNELWKKDESGNWSLWTDNLLSQVVGSSVGATWADIDNDGFQDLLLLNNNAGKNRMYHNLGNGQFEELSNAVTSNGGFSVSSTWGDIDNDGDLDLFISNASNKNNELYFNNGSGDFTLSTVGSIVNDGGHSHGASFADIDNDMDLDLFVANDQGSKFLYLNKGNGEFVRDRSELVNFNFGNAFGVAFSDIDSDGDMDLITSTHSNQENVLFKTNNNSNNWLKIRLEGTASNKSGIGARIRVKANGEWMTRFVNSQNGIGGQGSYRQHFGLGNDTKVDVEIYWPSGFIQTLTNINKNSNLLLVEPSGAETTIIAFNDANKNCKYDLGEQLLDGVKFSFNNNLTAVSDENGLVKINLAKGKYNITFDDTKFKTKCSVTTKIDIKNTTARFVGYYPLTPLCSESDLEVSAYTVVMRRGFNTKYHIDVKNIGLKTANGITLTANIPANIEVDSSNLDWTSISTGVNGESIITWSLGNLSYNQLNTLELYFRVSLDAQLNDVLESSFNVTTTSQECGISNNDFVDIQTVVGSIDPNDLLVYPLGESEEHFIKNSQKITYRIRFQNVGNYEADFVNILDELPKGVDASTISNIVSSHRYQLTIEDNKLHFYFPEIYLPDSASNLEGSNGFIQFTVDQKSSVENGEVLYNLALIQFDYNEYIVTNTVFHTVIVDENNDTKGSLVLFPNPANDYSFARIAIDNELDQEISQIKIFTQSGEVVYSEVGNSNVMKLDVSNLPLGLYFVKAISLDGKEFSGKLQVIKF